ncbi:hypothetical protein EJB05_51687, partial [Eragrostis curvula]
MAALAIYRRSLSSIALPCLRSGHGLLPRTMGGSGLWHAPPPARGGISRRCGDWMVPPQLDGRGVAGSSYSSLSHGKGTPEKDGVLRALLALAEKQEKDTANQLRMTQTFLDEQSKMLALMSELKNPPIFGWKIKDLIIGTRSSIITHANVILNDPVTQATLQATFDLFYQSGMNMFRPSYWLKRPKDKNPGPTAEEIASRVSCYACMIISIVGGVGEMDEDALLASLGTLGVKDDPLIKETLEVLVKIRFVQRKTYTLEGKEVTKYVVLKGDHDKFMAHKMAPEIKKALGKKGLLDRIIR